MDNKNKINNDDNFNGSIETPLRPDAFCTDDELKKELIAKHFKEIMFILGLDLDDDSLKDTPMRVAKMYIDEHFSGLNPKNKPALTLFDNAYNYNQMLMEKNIPVQSHCEHHFVPIIGKAHIAYISTGKVIGLSKLNRIVEYYSNRPQVQERLTVQIANEISEALNTPDVAVVIDAEHFCVSTRGVKHDNCSTMTFEYLGRFKDECKRKEFLGLIQKK